MPELTRRRLPDVVDKGTSPELYGRTLSWRRRGGRLNAAQQLAWDSHSATWLLKPPNGSFDAQAVFGREAPLILEIGSGMGEATAFMAAGRPDVNVLAVEVWQPGIAQTFHHLAEAGAENVRVMCADAVPVLTAMEPETLAEVWLFFPDPWPKVRQAGGEVTPSFAQLLASRLREGGVLRMATDWEPYARQMLAVCTAEPQLRNEHDGFAPRPNFRPVTRFERRGLTAGRAISTWSLRVADTSGGMTSLTLEHG